MILLEEQDIFSLGSQEKKWRQQQVTDSSCAHLCLCMEVTLPVHRQMDSETKAPG